MPDGEWRCGKSGCGGVDGLGLYARVALKTGQTIGEVEGPRASEELAKAKSEIASLKSESARLKQQLDTLQMAMVDTSTEAEALRAKAAARGDVVRQMRKEKVRAICRARRLQSAARAPGRPRARAA